METKIKPILVPNSEPFDEGTGYSDVITPGAQRHEGHINLVNPSLKNTGSDAGGEGGTSGNHGGDATSHPKAPVQKNVP